MNPELLSEAKSLWERDERIAKFAQRFNIYPLAEARVLVDGFHHLDAAIVEPAVFTTQDEVYEGELKRRAGSRALELDAYLSGRNYTPQDMMAVLAIEEGDLTGLRGWLVDRRPRVLETVGRIYAGALVDDYTLNLATDIPAVQRQAQEFVASHIQNYHKKLGRLFEGLTQAGTFLRDIAAVPTMNERTNDRSYFNPLTKTLAIGLSGVCFMDGDGALHINERELIRLFGHEGMGHGINQVMTDASSLPFFLKTSASATSSTVESVAQFYERQIFDDLADSPATQRELNIAHRFSDLYQEAKDIFEVVEYNYRFFYYAITVLADKEMGDPTNPQTMARKVDLLSEVALYPGQPRTIIEGNRQQFDSEGNLNPQLVSELRYAARPVQRALDYLRSLGISYDGQNRGRIDTIFFSGFWTPIGFVQNLAQQFSS